jgi:hypothetical protein
LLIHVVCILTDFNKDQTLGSKQRGTSKKEESERGVGRDRKEVVIGGSGIEEGKGNRVFVLGRRKGW